MGFFLLYLLLINALAFVLMLVDKRRARKNLWRIRESTLFAAAIAGGSVGILTGMYAVRHKTRHRSFVIGIPAILAIQTVGLVFVLMHFYA